MLYLKISLCVKTAEPGWNLLSDGGGGHFLSLFMQQNHINFAHLAYYWKLFTHLIHTKEIHVLTCFPIAGVMVTQI